ncbi:MAG: G-D-S-L family lipolytic protein [Flavobacteriaceae bacterium]|nr:G-D-S-L family lipolytic protein [Flavobacteriaceae bacterium]
MKNIKYIAIIALGLIACEPELDNSVEDAGFYSAGTADFSTFVSVGNSLTAGYADGTVYLEGQKYSYPNILADRFSHVGGGTFTQPLVSDNIGGLILSGNPIPGFDTRLVLTGDPLAPANLDEIPTTEVSNILTGPFNNMSAPGAKSFHLLSDAYGNISGVETGTANPYFVRMASSSSATMLGDAVAQNPTFFSLWIGNNDILSFATSGGVGVDQLGNTNPLTHGPNDITDPTLFHGTYDAILSGLTTNGAKGVVMNLPSVTSIPFFTYVDHNPVPLDAATAGFLNSANAYGAYNAGIQGAFAYLVSVSAITQADADLEIIKRTIIFSESANNALVIMDESLTDLTGINSDLVSMRQATPADLILLTTGPVIGTLAIEGDPTSVIGVSLPLNDSQVLTESEVTMITNAQTAYNNSISMLAAANEDVILVDVKAAMEQLSNGGLSSNGVTITGVYATGGGFSLDGVHPTARGYAFISNIILKRINEEFNATIPETNTGNYPTAYID